MQYGIQEAVAKAFKRAGSQEVEEESGPTQAEMIAGKIRQAFWPQRDLEVKRQRAIQSVIEEAKNG